VRKKSKNDQYAVLKTKEKGKVKTKRQRGEKREISWKNGGA